MKILYKNRFSQIARVCDDFDGVLWVTKSRERVHTHAVRNGVILEFQGSVKREGVFEGRYKPVGGCIGFTPYKGTTAKEVVKRASVFPGEVYDAHVRPIPKVDDPCEVVWPATKGLIVHNDKILVIRESSEYPEGTQRGKFDVVGGRAKPDERFVPAGNLRREIKEETGLEVTVHEDFCSYDWVVGDTRIVGNFFVCRASTDKVQLSSDHDRYKWIKPENHRRNNLIPGLEKVFEVYRGKYC